MALVPLLDPIESRFEWEKAHPWLEKNWTVSIYCSAVYVALVFLGKRWMSDRQPFSLRRPLVMWNVGLAIFSIVGFLSIVRPMVSSGVENGAAYVACHEVVLTRPPTALWGFLFVLSKVVEFGDTFFVVLRKTPLNFLHWYHHITVFVYSAYNISLEDPTGDWFGALNYFVHSFMYSYYTLKASGFQLHRLVARSITLLQLSQFVVGLALLGFVYWQKSSGRECAAHYQPMYFGTAMYASYLVLFANFFYQRYIKRRLPAK